VVLETAEFFADESDEAYWSFVEAWAGGTEPRPRDGATKDEDPDAFFARCASRVRDVAKKVAGPDSGLGILELSLGIRRYSPRLEMFRAVAQEHAASVEKREPSEADERTNRKDEKDPECCVARAGDAVASDLATLTRMLVNLESDPENNPSGAYSIPRASTSDHAYPAPAPAPALDESLGGEGSRKGGGTGDRGPNEGDDARASAATAPPPPAVTLYASLGSDCFASFHGALRDAAERGAVRYVHRPVLMDGACALQGDGCAALGSGFLPDAGGSAGFFSGDASALSGKTDSGSGPDGAVPNPARLTAAGYGVEMAIKNMEYKAIDDDSSADAGAGAGESAAANDASPELKLKQIRDLGLQATQRVVRSDDPLQTMMDLSFDFPAIAAELSAVRVDEATAAAAAENAQKLSGGGSLVMSLNGEPLEMETVNVFSLLDRVADELRLADVFLSLGLEHATVRRLLRMRVAAGGGGGGASGAPDFPRLDVVDPERDPASPRFANDVEKDRAFKSWDPSLSGLLVPDPLGGPPRVRRNLLNFIAVVVLGDDADEENADDASRASWALLDALDRAAEQGVGFRVAHVLLTGDDTDDKNTKKTTLTFPPVSASPTRWPARTRRWRVGSEGGTRGRFCAKSFLRGRRRPRTRSRRPRVSARRPGATPSARSRARTSAGSAPRRRSGGRRKARKRVTVARRRSRRTKTSTPTFARRWRMCFASTANRRRRRSRPRRARRWPAAGSPVFRVW
jgi:UDP-glucose:glycoprotein glucosyltransferase